MPPHRMSRRRRGVPVIVRGLGVQGELFPGSRGRACDMPPATFVTDSERAEYRFIDA
ncbi:hypothetical protein [Corynebacterium accolens]|uniref:hypothetical protein n=1 Tax=Corynebacterium accolens TaxID=38284 RepID=UPI00254C9EF5|nr:hypothetical protein [Corynebacterium accolens]MDK8680218.1 hypothetical protein [Corynebacterium accolens]